jgi:hypothetical protein
MVPSQIPPPPPPPLPPPPAHTHSTVPPFSSHFGGSQNSSF